jgi:hypothetical protein
LAHVLAPRFHRYNAAVDISSAAKATRCHQHEDGRRTAGAGVVNVRSTEISKLT